MFMNETKHLFGWMAKHFCWDGCCLLMKQSICLDGWFIVKQSIFVEGYDFGVFFELQQLLLFSFTLI